jgi:exosortase/archaeosortase family protein
MSRGNPPAGPEMTIIGRDGSGSYANSNGSLNNNDPHNPYLVGEVTSYERGVNLPTREIEIAPQCSGIRAAIFLLVLTLFPAHLFLKEPWTKFLLVMTVFPIAAIKNGFRIFTLTVIDMYVLPGTLMVISTIKVARSSS